MQRAPLFASIAVLIAGTVLAQVHAKKKAVDPALAPFVGTWKLVSSQMRLPDGTVKPYGFGPRAVGTLMYDAGGRLCVQVVNPDRPLWADPDHPTPQEIKTSFDGFGGYCGTFTVDTERRVVTHVPEIGFDPNVKGKPSPRNYTLDEDRLVYDGVDTSDGAEVKWTMIWERVSR